MRLNKFSSAAVILLLAKISAFAVGEIGIGLNLGLTYDPNNIEPEISAVNARMIEYERTNPGTDLTTLNLPYSPVIGTNVRYTLNNLMLRTGVIYARPFLYPSTGNIAPPAGTDNVIKYDSYVLSFPVQVCLMMRLGVNTSVYFGAGAAAHISYLEVTQSSPGGGFVDPDIASAKYSAAHIGWNFIAGAEAPLSDRSSVTVEWFYQNAVSGAAKNSGGAPPRALNSSCSMILFGINYYLRLN